MLKSDHYRLVYLLALLAGLGFALYLFPPGFISGQQVFTLTPLGDRAQHIVGQRYFLAQPWHWPLLVADALVPPNGTNIAFTDSIPLLSMATKLVSGLLPAGVQTISFWLALCWVLQPVGAVFALRSCGERRFLPGLAVAVLSLCIPTLYARVVHTALCSHFLILLALGSYFRLVGLVSPLNLLFATGLMLTSLLVHPYIMVMVMALQAAAPCSLWLRGQPDWRRAALGVSAGVVVTACVAAALGYIGADPPTGFAYYSMNLVAPVYPVFSPFFPWASELIDATGGQGEGFQYLGIGLWILILAAVILAARLRIGLLRRHGGLVAACLCLALFSLSTRVYAGHLLLLDLPTPEILGNLHGSGRFFWPVTYTLLIGSVAVVSRAPRTATSALLLGTAVVLQFVDTSKIRRDVHNFYHYATPHWYVDAATLRPVLRESDRLNIWPTVRCGTDPYFPPFSQLLLLASERPVPVNTMQVARTFGAVQCDALPYTQTALAPRELRVFFPGVEASALLGLPGSPELCRQLGSLMACSAQFAGREDLPRLTFRQTPLDRTLRVGSEGDGNFVLGNGWSHPESWGVWSDGPQAVIVLRPGPAQARQKLRLTLWGRRFPSRSGDTHVSVWVNDVELGFWDGGNTIVTPWSVTLPAPAAADPVILVRLQIADPTSPHDLGMSLDPRKLGVALEALRLEPEQP